MATQPTKRAVEKNVGAIKNLNCRKMKKMQTKRMHRKNCSFLKTWPSAQKKEKQMY
jgi:hypothetical protein